MDAVDDQVLHAKWLPFPDAADSYSLHRFIMAVGATGQLHVFDSSGARLQSQSTGHQYPIKGEINACRNTAITSQKCADKSHARNCMLDFPILNPIEPSKAQKIHFTLPFSNGLSKQRSTSHPPPPASPWPLATPPARSASSP